MVISSPLPSLQVHRMFPGKLAEEEFGPSVDFREYSFLDNPRTPPAVRGTPRYTAAPLHTFQHNKVQYSIV